MLAAFELDEVNSVLQQLMEKARSAGFGGGESEHHKNFKNAVAQNPNLLGLDVPPGRTEYRLLSADCIDVVFINKTELIAVEVKSSISADIDILRGLFQCVKYKYLIQAEQIVENMEPNTMVILALQGTFPAKLLSVKNCLGIEVIDQIKSL
ncbi:MULTISPECIES: hypothetical protein [Flavobacterium]|uniref:Uncharacterized protein n=1 Tax=Flavobacterium ginsengiterrae TaxID=871695 RepID=A0ABP7GQG7_9FLAO|nr:hypothetical protein [Flavobacterium gelatinilyticum]